MSDYEDQKAKLTFQSDVNYFASTDFAQIWAEIDNDAWLGTGDAMGTFELTRPDGSTDTKYLPVQTDPSPSTQGARVWFAVEGVSGEQHGDTKLRLSELSGAEAGG